MRVNWQLSSDRHCVRFFRSISFARNANVLCTLNTQKIKSGTNRLILAIQLLRMECTDLTQNQQNQIVFFFFFHYWLHIDATLQSKLSPNRPNDANNLSSVNFLCRKCLLFNSVYSHLLHWMPAINVKNIQYLAWNNNTK